MAPIIIPLGAACGANLLTVMAGIVCGGTFCSHACFYSDATVISFLLVVELKIVEYVYSQLPVYHSFCGCSKFIVFNIGISFLIGREYEKFYYSNVQSHICQFHKPLVEVLHNYGYEEAVAAQNNLVEKNGLKLDFVDKVFNVPFALIFLKVKRIYVHIKN